MSHGRHDDLDDLGDVRRAQGGCNESVAHDCLVLGVCALVFELILIFGGALRSLDKPLNQIIEFSHSTLYSGRVWAPEADPFGEDLRFVNF